MSNAYDTQVVRNRHKISWQEEYVLGMVNAEAPLGTMAVLKIAEAQTVMTPATTHKYLHKLILRNLKSYYTKLQLNSIHYFLL